VLNMGHYPQDLAIESELDFKIATGRVPGFTSIHKFGSTEVGSTVLQDIWSFGGLKQYATEGVAMFMWSTVDEDATDIQIFGLDENWELQSATVAVTGNTVVAIPGLWTRIFKGRNEGPPVFTGVIYIARSAASAPAAPLIAVAEAKLEPITQGTQMTHYTVPAGHTAFIKNFFLGTEKGVETKGYGFHRSFGGVFNAEEILAMYQGSVSKLLPYLAFPEKSDFVIRAIADTTNSFMAGSYDIILVQNDPHLIQV